MEKDLVQLGMEALDVVAIINALLFVGILLAAVFLWLRGIIPVLYRLGNGLARRRIAIFASGDQQESLKVALTDSKLFRKKNIVRISDRDDFGRAEDATMFLVYWPDFSDEMEAILKMKADQDALIVYAPQESGLVPADVLKTINRHRNVMLCNFRGRLLNDIVSSMITTSYETR